MRHIGNFLSVHRVRPGEETAANSDDYDADTALDLSVEGFRQALEPPAQQIAAGTKRKLTSEELTSAACEPASATWASSEDTLTDSSNPFAHSDAKQPLKTARQKRPKLAGHVATNEPGAAPNVNVVQASNRTEKVRAWRAELAQRQAPRQEESTGEAENLNCRALAEPLRWGLHGARGRGSRKY